MDAVSGGAGKSISRGTGVSQWEGRILPGSQPCLGQDNGWKSFGNKTPGAGWEGKPP